MARQARHVCMAKTALEFIRGVEEPNIPEVRLTRSRDGASGTATFIFQNPTVFDASSELHALAPAAVPPCARRANR